MKAFFVFDVESIGLHGEGFAVAGGIYLENGAVQSEFELACDPAMAAGSAEDRQWVMDHVPVLNITNRTPRSVRAQFMLIWFEAKRLWPEIEMAVECGWPVEANFLTACGKDDPCGWGLNGPYPLHEIASFMQAAGMNPMATYERKMSERPGHNPLCDARLSARLLSEALTALAIKEAN